MRNILKIMSAIMLICMLFSLASCDVSVTDGIFVADNAEHSESGETDTQCFTFPESTSYETSIQITDIATETETDYTETETAFEKVKLVIWSGSQSWKYDGQVKSNGEWGLSEGELLPGHTLNVTLDTTITNVGKRTNKIRATILDGNSKDVTDLYEVELRPGTLEIFSSTEE